MNVTGRRKRAERLAPDTTRVVTVFDVDLPPGLAFIRSLGRAGVPVVACSARRTAAGRLSRYVSAWHRSPNVRECDGFVAWLTEQLGSGAIDLVAPTSDWVMFCVAEAMERLGRPAKEVGHPEPERIRTCLVKDRFAAQLSRRGFPTPPAGIPTSLPQALRLADELGYPVLLKPRTHVGIGTIRGVVIHTPDELRAAYRPFVSDLEQQTVRRHVPGLCLPILQRYHDLGSVDVISVSGCLGGGGEVMALHHSRKLTQAPARLGVGTMFEPLGPQPFTQAAVEVVREVLGSGLFELEVLVERSTGDHYAIDLNPRGFGHLALDIATGHDLPRLWYESVTGAQLEAAAPATMPRLWQDGVPSYLGLGLALARGPARRTALERGLDIIRAPKVGAAFAWSDPLPGALCSLRHLRHPRSLVRQFLVDVERPRAPSEPHIHSDFQSRGAHPSRAWRETTPAECSG